jgi:LacI family transcriptional regulator
MSVTRPASLTSIAATAGVSVSTVPKVLNGRTDVAPGTRARVGRILRQQGYRVAAGSGARAVDLLIGGLGSLWADEMILGAVTAAADTGSSLVVSRFTSQEEFARQLGAALARGTAGAVSVLHVPGEAVLRRLADEHVPFVVIDPPAEPDGESVLSVGTTNFQGGLAAARHLIELGHRRIAAIGGPDRLWSCRTRLDGYRSALRRAGLPGDEGLVRYGRLCVEDGFSQAESLLRMGDPPTAIVAANDAQAFGVLQALAAVGMRAPDDVSVTGFDDLPVATWSAPPLTTVRQPLAAMAASGFRMLRSDPATAAGEPHHIELATMLVVRESTGAPRNR